VFLIANHGCERPERSAGERRIAHESKGNNHMPSIEEYAQSLVRRPPDPKRSRLVRILIGGLTVLVVVLGFVNLLQSNQFAALSGNGTISGTAIDSNGDPVAVELFIERSTIASRSDPAGSFVISGVPIGQQIVVVAYNGMGQEYPVVVTAGGVTDIGVVRVAKTAVPGP
jgi:hypothetical protein